jgi:hypothetical protein
MIDRTKKVFGISGGIIGGTTSGNEYKFYSAIPYPSRNSTDPPGLHLKQVLDYLRLFHDFLEQRRHRFDHYSSWYKAGKVVLRDLRWILFNLLKIILLSSANLLRKL